MRVFAASLLAVLIMAGCSEQEPRVRDLATATPPESATPTAVRGGPSVVIPPSAYVLDVSGTPVEGGTGTYCWMLGGGGMCRDLTGPRTNAEPIPLAAGSPLRFEFDAGRPRGLTVDWTSAEELRSSPGEHNTLDWGPKDGANYRGPAYTDALTAPEEPGLYVLAAFVLFPEGDVTYGFYIEVH